MSDTPKANTAYTPGPWRLWERGWGMFAVDSATRQICSVWSRLDEHQGTPRANAQLIAAAPEMLSALQCCVEWMESQMDEAARMEHMLDAHDPDQCCLCAARAAIAKAEGIKDP